MRIVDKDSLTAGLYKLAEDVANPRPDKRTSFWWGAKVWEAGKHLVLMQCFNQWFIVEVGGKTYNGVGCGTNDKSNQLRFAAILPHLERVDDTIQSLYTQHDGTSWRPWVIPQKLIDMGKITLDDVRQALIGVNEE